MLKTKTGASKAPRAAVSTPFLQLSVCRGTSAFRTGLRRTTSRRPVVVPVGRSVGIDRGRMSRKLILPRTARPPREASGRHVADTFSRSREKVGARRLPSGNVFARCSLVPAAGEKAGYGDILVEFFPEQSGPADFDEFALRVQILKERP